MKILIVIDGGDPYFMEYQEEDKNVFVTGMWEFCPGCLAEMEPELYLASHLVDPERASDVVARNINAIEELMK
jgi:hypothetical protein